MTGAGERDVWLPGGSRDALSQYSIAPGGDRVAVAERGQEGLLPAF